MIINILFVNFAIKIVNRDNYWTHIRTCKTKLNYEEELSNKLKELIPRDKNKNVTNITNYIINDNRQIDNSQTINDNRTNSCSQFF